MQHKTITLILLLAMHSVGAPTRNNEIGESSSWSSKTSILISHQGKETHQKRNAMTFLPNGKRSEKDADEAIAYVWGGWTPTNGSHPPVWRNKSKRRRLRSATQIKGGDEHKPRFPWDFPSNVVYWMGIEAVRKTPLLGPQIEPFMKLSTSKYSSTLCYSRRSSWWHL